MQRISSDHLQPELQEISSEIDPVYWLPDGCSELYRANVKVFKNRVRKYPPD